MHIFFQRSVSDVNHPHHWIFAYVVCEGSSGKETILIGFATLLQDGRCKTLDASADGYMRGESCVVHLVETMDPSQLEQGNCEHALMIQGTAVNQDGRSSSLTVDLLTDPRQLAGPR